MDVRGGVKTFTLVINYLIETWEPMHAIVGLSKENETTNLCMARQLQTLVENFGLIHRVLAFVKYEGNNLASMATTLHSIVDYELLNLQHVYKGTCFDCVLFKACQYATNDDKVKDGELN
jgi:hypothetical protein